MDILDLKFMQGFIRMAGDGYALGWHERNGGNLSYRMKSEDVNQATPFFNPPSTFSPIGIRAANLAGEFFLVTGSGKFMRNIPLAPAENIGILELDDLGENYRIIWGLENHAMPTSELPSHILNHSIKKETTNGAHRVIYHAHTPNLIAMTFILPLDEKIFSRTLWSMISECSIVFPKGVGVVPWMVPGSFEIALATSEMMRKFDVAVWAHHGVFCSGPDFDITFGLMNTVEKAAEIYIKIMSAGGIRQVITSEQLIAVARSFKVELRVEFLD